MAGDNERAERSGQGGAQIEADEDDEATRAGEAVAAAVVEAVSPQRLISGEGAEVANNEISVGGRGVGDTNTIRQAAAAAADVAAAAVAAASVTVVAEREAAADALDVAQVMAAAAAAAVGAAVRERVRAVAADEHALHASAHNSGRVNANSETGGVGDIREGGTGFEGSGEGAPNEGEQGY